MAESNPQRKLGLVTFEQAVEIVGDGVEKPIELAGDILNEFD